MNISFLSRIISFWLLLLVLLQSLQALKLFDENQERVNTRSEVALARRLLNVISSSFNY